LPPEELDKFMNKYKAVKEGRQMDESAYQDFKIAQVNDMTALLN
jgi:splicing factor 4